MFSDKLEAKKEIEKLRKEIEYHNNLYYNHDKPEISDYAYDMLLQKLADLEEEYPEYASKDSPTQKVGGKADNKFTPVKHQVEMQSLVDKFNFKDLKDSVDKIGDVFYSVEPKIDGLSVELEYLDGVLIKAATRGDGKVGEDVTENVKMISTVPQTLRYNKKHLIVRGEIFMPKESFSALNDECLKMNKTLFKNPRNAAAGTLRQLDANVVKDRGLDILIFNVQLDEDAQWLSHIDSLENMRVLGLPIVPFKVATADEVVDNVKRIAFERDTYDYEIDGAVVKADSLALRRELGNTSKYPRWAVAYKYAPEEMETDLLSIELQVGRTGQITPKAIFKPIQLGGSTVMAASLHNMDHVEELDLWIGDVIRVHKAGEIIPEVIGPVVSKRTDSCHKFVFDGNCPSCGKPAAKIGKFYKCQNEYCPAQLKRRLEHFCGKDGLDIKGLGPKLCSELVDNYLVRDLPGLYKLSAFDLMHLGYGIRQAHNIIFNIENSKKCTFPRLISAIGLKGVGSINALYIADHFSVISDFMSASIEDLLEIDGLGEESSKSIYEQINDKAFIDLIKRLSFAGVIAAN